MPSAVRWASRFPERIVILVLQMRSASAMNAREVVEELYLAALSRRPTSDELAKLTGFVSKANDRRAAVEDVVWGLVNSKEFLFNH